MSSKALTENDSDALSLAKPARAVSGLWPLLAGLASLVAVGATLRAQVAGNTAAIEQIKNDRGADVRVLDERLRKLEEGVATLLERTKGK